MNETQVTKYWQMPYEEWRKNYEVALPVKNSGKTEYVNYHVMVEHLRKLCPNLIPELISADVLEDYTVVVKVQLWHNVLNLPSATHRMAVMRLGGAMHNAVPSPDARLMTDGIRRAFCRLIAEETGIGYSCWLDYDDYAEPAAVQETPTLPWASCNNAILQTVPQQQAYQDPAQQYAMQQMGQFTQQVPQPQQQWGEQWANDVFGELQPPVTEVAQPPQRRR